MNFKKIIIIGNFLLPYIFSMPLTAQEVRLPFSFGVNTGAQIGWWLVDNGSTNPNISNTEGYDNSHLSTFLPVEINLLYHKKSLRIGFGGTYYAFFDKNIRRQYYNKPINYSYPISNGHVDFWGIHIMSEWELFSNKKWTIAPHLKFGTFWINSLHPDRENFGLKTNVEFGINQEFFLGRTTLLLRPIYRTGIIQPKQKISKNHKHNLYAFGIMTGLRFNLNKTL